MIKVKQFLVPRCVIVRDNTNKAAESESLEAGVGFLLSFSGFSSRLYIVSFSFGHIASV